MAQSTISAAEFKTHCFRLLDEVQRTRVPLVITKRGRPVARVVVVENTAPRLYGALRGTATQTGDIVASIGEAWNAER